MFLLGRYVVSIEELVSQDFEIDAPSVEEAKRIAKEKYNNCEIVLEPGELQQKGYLLLMKMVLAVTGKNSKNNLKDTGF